jgi:hypothetical protein
MYQNDFDAVEWMLSRHPGLARNGREQFDQARNFALMWNMFESYVCNQSASVGTIEAAINRLKEDNLLERVDFESYLSFIKDRYTSGDSFTVRFPHLNLRSRDRESLVRDVLLGENNQDKDVALACLIVVFRYRNNLFHGIKEINELGSQSELFERSSRLLAQVLEAKGT